MAKINTRPVLAAGIFNIAVWVFKREFDFKNSEIYNDLPAGIFTFFVLSCFIFYLSEEFMLRFQNSLISDIEKHFEKDENLNEKKVSIFIPKKRVIGYSKGSDIVEPFFSQHKIYAYNFLLILYLIDTVILFDYNFSFFLDSAQFLHNFLLGFSYSTTT